MSTSPYYNKTQVDVKVDDLEQQIANVADGTAGKAYPNLTTAMSITPLPDNGVIFTIDEDNETEAGVYAYDSNEVNGYRFVRDIIKVVDTLNSNSSNSALSANRGRELKNEVDSIKYRNVYTSLSVNLNGSGAYRKDNGNSAANLEYSRTTASSVISINPDLQYAYSGEIDNELYAGIIYRDDDGLLIGVEVAEIGVFIKRSIVVPEGATRIHFCSKNTAEEMQLFTVSKEEKEYIENDKITQNISDSTTTIPSSKVVYDIYNSKLDKQEDYYTPISVSFNGNGTYRADNGNSAGESGYVRTSSTSYINIEPNARYAYSGEITNSTYAGVVFKDDDNTFIGSVCNEIKVYNKEEIVIPEGATRILVSSLDIENKGLYIVEKVDKTLSIKKYKTIHDFKNSEKEYRTLSSVGAYLFNNDTEESIPILNRITNKSRIIEKKDAGTYQLSDWDNYNNIGYFSTVLSVYESENLEDFTLLYTFQESVYGVRPTTDGEIVVATRGRDGEEPGGIWRSSEGKTIFTKVYTFESPSTNVSPSEQWGFEAWDNIFVLNNYDSRPSGEREDARVYMSIDDGNTFEVIFDMYQSSFYNDIVNADPDQEGRAHIHGSCYDPYEDRVWIATGDSLHKWIIYSNKGISKDLENIEWNGIYIADNPIYGSMQMCPIFATRFGILAGSDFKYNGIYLVHRDENPQLDLVHYITPDDNTRITFIPRKLIQGDSGVVYVPCGYMYNELQPSTDRKNHIMASSDGLNWTRIYESEEDLTNSSIEIVVRERKDDILIYDSSDNNFIIMTKPKIR